MTRRDGFNYALAIALIFILATLLLIAPLSIAKADSSALRELLSQYEDPRMTVQDLAFFLVTHNFDAYPKGSYVEAHIDNAVYKLVPNGDQPGLASLN